jgi:predicted component of type VI protein secretion system
MALLLTVTEPQDPLPGLQNTMVFGPRGGCIGRGQDNDWVLPDPQRYLSVHHARVRCYQGVYYIEDTSTNGVFLNGSARPLGKSPSPALRDGDRLRMGGYELQVSISASDREAANDSIELEAAALSSDSVEALLIDHSNILPALTDVEPATLAPEPDAEPLPLDSPLADRRRVPRVAVGASAEFDAFCRGAGVPASELPTNSRLAALQLAGLMLREALVGARELAKSRREILRSAGLNPEVEESGRAALQRYSIEELLKQFLSAQDPTLPEAVPWLREVFSTARRNDAAFVQATRQALTEFLRRLEPGALSAGGAAPEERFRALTDMAHDALPALYVEALSRHFAALVRESH